MLDGIQDDSRHTANYRAEPKKAGDMAVVIEGEMSPLLRQGSLRETKLE